MLLAVAIVFTSLNTQDVYAAKKKTQKPTITVKTMTVNQGYTGNKKPISVKNAKGKVTYSLASNKNKFTISKTTWSCALGLTAESISSLQNMQKRCKNLPGPLL